MPMPRRRPLEDPNQYYAYVWRFRGFAVWVGYGRNNRGRPTCKALWSGRPPELLNLLETNRHEIEVEILPCASESEAVEKERQLIKRLKPLYNTAPSRGGYKGMHTSEGLARIADAQIGREYSDEVRLGRRVRMLGNKNLLGHKHSTEAKRKISVAAKGRSPSDLCKSKSSERMKLRNKTNPPRKGKPCSEEHRRKLSEAARRRFHASHV